MKEAQGRAPTVLRFSGGGRHAHPPAKSGHVLARPACAAGPHTLHTNYAKRRVEETAVAALRVTSFLRRRSSPDEAPRPKRGDPMQQRSATIHHARHQEDRPHNAVIAQGGVEQTSRRTIIQEQPEGHCGGKRLMVQQHRVCGRPVVIPTTGQTQDRGSPERRLVAHDHPWYSGALMHHGPFSLCACGAWTLQAGRSLPRLVACHPTARPSGQVAKLTAHVRTSANQGTSIMRHAPLSSASVTGQRRSASPPPSS